MPPEDLRHLLRVGRAARGADQFSRFAEVRRAHDCRGYDGELLGILSAEVIEAVHRASWDEQRLPRPHLDGRAVNRPGQDALDTVDDLLVGVVLVSGRRQLLSGGNDKLNTDALPWESLPVRRKRISTGPTWMVSSEGLTLCVPCCMMASLCRRCCFTSARLTRFVHQHRTVYLRRSNPLAWPLPSADRTAVKIRDSGIGQKPHICQRRDMWATHYKRAPLSQ